MVKARGTALHDRIKTADNKFQRDFYQIHRLCLHLGATTEKDKQVRLGSSTSRKRSKNSLRNECVLSGGEMKEEVQGCCSTRWLHSSKHSGIKDLELNQWNKGRKKAMKARKQRPSIVLKCFHIICCRLKSGRWRKRACCRLINTRNNGNRGKGFKVDSVDAMLQSCLNTDLICKYSIRISPFARIRLQNIYVSQAKPSSIPTNPIVKSALQPTSPKSNMSKSNLWQTDSKCLYQENEEWIATHFYTPSFSVFEWDYQVVSSQKTPSVQVKSQVLNSTFTCKSFFDFVRSSLKF